MRQFVKSGQVNVPSNSVQQYQANLGTALNSLLIKTYVQDTNGQILLAMVSQNRRRCSNVT